MSSRYVCDSFDEELDEKLDAKSIEEFERDILLSVNSVVHEWNTDMVAVINSLLFTCKRKLVVFSTTNSMVMGLRIKIIYTKDV